MDLLVGWNTTKSALCHGLRALLLSPSPFLPVHCSLFGLKSPFLVTADKLQDRWDQPAEAALADFVTRALQAARAIVGDPALLAALHKENSGEASQANIHAPEARKASLFSDGFPIAYVAALATGGVARAIVRCLTACRLRWRPSPQKLSSRA